MKKGFYKVRLIHDDNSQSNRVQKGLLGEYFATHIKVKDKDMYTVTHIPTGYRVADFTYQREAIAFIKKADKVPGIEKMSITNAREWRDTIISIAYKVTGK